MKRNIDINQISDGKLYTSNDMAKIDCHGCKDCSDCCHGMGNSIILDPADIYRIFLGTGKDFATLLQEEKIGLKVVDGLILPHLNLSGKEEGCSYLNDQGRCSIHAYRPGICRLFPLGRIYGESGFQYFLQIHECSMKNRSKIKIKKWLEMPRLMEYEQYILLWHKFLMACEEELSQLSEQEHQILTTYILRTFYQTPYEAKEERTFYREFESRMKLAEQTLGVVFR